MFTRVHRLITAFIFLFSFLLYLKTMAPTASFWDCGEWIATAYIMGVPHPPGSPLFLLIGRFFTLLPTFSDIGARMNLISPIASALAVMFLYLIIVQLVRRWRGEVASVSDALITYGAGVVAALTFMVTDSHWFNAVEAEVYGLSTFFTAFSVWLILRWSQKDETGSHSHYILLLAYLFGLAVGLHLLNLLALPFVALILYFRRWTFTWLGFSITAGLTLVVFLVIYQGMIKGLPRLALAAGIPAVVLAVLVLIVATVWAVNKRKANLGIALASMLLILVGYSTYATVFIRSQQDPAIDENNPETLRQAVAYLEREQYGDWSMTDRARWTPETRHRYGSVSDYFWNYQVNKMYVRYFLWQFAGRGPSGTPGVSRYGATTAEDGVDWFQFGLPLALLFGFFGMGYHMYRDRKHGLAVLALFLATGLMIILYLNQPDPQPRERDYSYVGSFFAWSIWIGIGAAGLMEMLSKRLKETSLQRLMLSGFLGVLIIIMPGVMLFANYHHHDRTGNFVAWDYSYNLLNSCAQNSVLFTNGDNDTFPLWYLQEVEGIRKDVRVVNLSLLNTDWYIRQLRDYEPRLPLNLSDEAIRQMTPISWERKQVRLPVKISGPEPLYLEWDLKPTFAGRFLRTQDRMIVQILRDLDWKEQPIYFAVTVAPENKIGLNKYLEMQGLVYEVKSQPTRQVNIEKLRHNLLEVYRYRNLNDPSVYFNLNIQRLMQNLRASWLQLALNEVINKNPEGAKAILDRLTATIPEKVIPIRNKDLYFQISQLYSEVGDTMELRRRLEIMPQQYRLGHRDYVNLGVIYYRELNDWASADAIFQEVYSKYPQNGELVGTLVQIYQDAGHPEQSVRILLDWLTIHPGDQGALDLLDKLQSG